MTGVASSLSTSCCRTVSCTPCMSRPRSEPPPWEASVTALPFPQLGEPSSHRTKGSNPQKSLSRPSTTITISPASSIISPLLNISPRTKIGPKYIQIRMIGTLPTSIATTSKSVFIGFQGGFFVVVFYNRSPFLFYFSETFIHPASLYNMPNPL